MIDLRKTLDTFLAGIPDEEKPVRLPGFKPGKTPTLEQAQIALNAMTEAVEPFVATGQGKEIMLLLPQYKQTNPATLFSLLGLWNPASMRCFMHFGDAYIVHTRNKLAQRFLESDCEWSLWVDDDMVLPIGNAAWFNGMTGLNLPSAVAGRHTINRLLAAKKSLVGGLYFGRSPKGKPMFFEGMNNPETARRLRTNFADTVLPTRWVGTGCLLVNRQVFLDIQKGMPFLAPKKPGDPWQFFSPTPDELLVLLDRPEGSVSHADLKAAAARYNPGVGEDVTFCRRASAVGHQPFVDVGLVCGHLGGSVYGPTNTGE